MADFWGIGQYRQELDEDKGTSLVMINSDKGKALFDSIQDSVFCEECSIEWALQGNSCILNVAEKNRFSDKFFEELGFIPFERLIHKYVKRNKKKSLKDIVDIVIRKLKK